MNILENLNEYWVGKITFPLSNYFFNRRNILSIFKKLLESEWYSEDILREMQLKKLLKIVEYANQYILFYRKRFREIGLLPKDIKSLEDIKLIPPLSREDVIDFHKDMVDIRLKSSIPFADKVKGDPGIPIPFARFRKHKLIRNTSSGSTGVPTVFYDDGSRSSFSWAHELRLKHWYGIMPGAKEARMVRLSTAYFPGSNVIGMRRRFWGQLILPGINLSDEDYSVCLLRILEYRPKVLLGYTPALAGLAGYILKNRINLGSYRPELGIGWAGPLYDHEKEILKRVFNCAVANNYGSREVGHVAGLCPHGSFHINQEDFFVESVRTDETLAGESPGEIVVTTLGISPMPFIRYRMGDVGEVTQSRCECGRSLQVLANFLGRTGEIFITKAGRMISPNFWCRTFMSGKISNAVRRFQVVYKKNKDLKIRIERDKGFSSDTESYIKETVARNFSPDTNLELEYVSGIGPEISGKYQMVTWE